MGTLGNLYSTCHAALGRVGNGSMLAYGSARKIMVHEC